MDEAGGEAAALLNMHVVVDVLAAVAVVAVALAAITELFIGIFRIGFAAHRTFVGIALIFMHLILLAACPFKVDGFPLHLVLDTAKHGADIAAEK